MYDINLYYFLFCMYPDDSTLHHHQMNVKKSSNSTTEEQVDGVPHGLSNIGLFALAFLQCPQLIRSVKQAVHLVHPAALQASLVAQAVQQWQQAT